MNMNWSYNDKEVSVEILAKGSMIENSMIADLSDAKFSYKGGRYVKANNRKNRGIAQELSDLYNKLPANWRNF